MIKTDYPHLIIEVSPDLLTPQLRDLLHRDCLALEHGITQPQIFIACPVLDEEHVIQIEETSKKYHNLLAITAAYLHRSKFRFMFTDLYRLYSPALTAYQYYLKFQRIYHRTDEIILPFPYNTDQH
jgi:hypothetical protein